MEYLDVFSKFAETLLVGLLPVLAAFIVRWVKAKAEFELARLQTEKREVYYALTFVVRLAVNAAEQANLAGLIKDKKAYAISVAEKYLAEMGITIDLDVIDAAVEAAVLEEFNKSAPGLEA